MSSATWGHQIDLLVRARTPLIWVRSNEEARVESLLGEAAQRLARQLVCWNFIDGISGPVNADGQGSRQPMAMLQWLQQRDAGSPTLLLAKDFHRFCDDPGVARMLRNLEASLRSTPHTLVLCCGQSTPPGDLEESLTLLDLPLPDSDDLRRLISSIGTSSGSPLPAPVLDELARACQRGSTAFVLVSGITGCCWRPGGPGQWSPQWFTTGNSRLSCSKAHCWGSN